MNFKKCSEHQETTEDGHRDLPRTSKGTRKQKSDIGLGRPTEGTISLQGGAEQKPSSTPSNVANSRRATKSGQLSRIAATGPYFVIRTTFLVKMTLRHEGMSPINGDTKL